jgi:hypothetical protein
MWRTILVILCNLVLTGTVVAQTSVTQRFEIFPIETGQGQGSAGSVPVYELTASALVIDKFNRKAWVCVARYDRRNLNDNKYDVHYEGSCLELGTKSLISTIPAGQPGAGQPDGGLFTVDSSQIKSVPFPAVRPNSILWIINQDQDQGHSQVHFCDFVSQDRCWTLPPLPNVHQ